ncbi:hypothetical protein DH2020_032377 [Rehmannia glutinosa]|uniref:DUF4283 domain-containing protein n=1 Tax=Rehmannia glutinosa TaxID=99300 RepID=A0ABR0VIP7_REHGL
MAFESSSLEDLCGRLQLEEEETGGLCLEGEEVEELNQDHRWCLIGRFLSDRLVNILVMKNTLASIWRPVKGVFIKDLGPNLFLFQFFHESDLSRVISSGPWTFDNQLLLTKRLSVGEQPSKVELFHTEIWVQIYDLPLGFMTERIGRDIGNFIGIYIEADKQSFVGVWRNYMRIRIAFDVRTPLKRRMKLKNPVVTGCGSISSHSDKFCEKLLNIPGGTDERAYGVWLKAPSRKAQNNIGSPWLRSSFPTADSGYNQEAGNGFSTSNASPSYVPTFSEGPSCVNGKNMDRGIILCDGGVESGWAVTNIEEWAVTKNSNMDETDVGGLNLGMKDYFYIDKIMGHGGGIALLWKEKNMANLLSFSSNHIDVEVHLKETATYRLTGFYGYPERNRRRESWSFLRQLAAQSNLPWCCIGDFNDIISPNEKRGSVPHPSWLLSGFRTAIDDCFWWIWGWLGIRTLGSEGEVQVIGLKKD